MVDSEKMLVTASAEQLRQTVRHARLQGSLIGCVPTMGALHAGHLSLIEACRNRCDLTVVTLFVNPTQFGPREDLDRYPRPWKEDLALCRSAGVDLVYHPEAASLYPTDFSTWVVEDQISTILEGEHRPGHFRGVATIVLKLFHLVQPDLAFFGAKDYQQQTLIRRMVRDLDLPIEIVTCPTVRDPDGLALSSRNQYLSPAERRTALAISKALARAKSRLESGEASPAVAEQELRQELEAEPGLDLQYAVIVDAETLLPLEHSAQQAVALVAAFVGKTRLIDNMPIEIPTSS